MPDQYYEPHVLIDADPLFTKGIRARMRRKAFVLSTDIRATLNHLGRYAAPRCFAFDVLEFCRGRGAVREEVGNFLRQARTGLKVGDGEPLVAAFVGSHGSLVPSNDAADTARLRNLGRDEPILETHWARKGRMMAAQLEQALRAVDGLELVWLAQCSRDFRPTLLETRYDDLAAQARRILASLPPPRAAGLLRPAIPLIMLKEPNWQAWRPMTAGGGRQRAYSTTAMLIEQFAHERASRPNLRGVLVKLLTDDLAAHCATDPPVVGERTLRQASEAGLEAILLDGRRGVVRWVDLRDVNGPRVCAA